MKKYLRRLFVLTIISFLGLSASLFSQYGTFEDYVNADGWSGNVAFYVPSGGGDKPLIIALHPGQTPESAMRDMMLGAAEQLNAVLAAPSGPDGDGTAIMPLVGWCKDNYSIDEDKVFLTGYSAGSRPTFEAGFPNHGTFRGLIGIAGGSTYGATAEALNNVGIGIIVGASDPYYSNITQMANQFEENGGYVKLIAKSGVGHTGAYYWGSEFTRDWKECYNFCLDIVFKPGRITLTSPSSGAQNLGIPVTLEWEADNNADSYEVEISDADGLVDIKTPTSNSVVLDDEIEPGVQYFWKARGVNEGGEGPWSYERAFTTLPEAPTATATLIYPQDGTLDLPSDRIIFQWTSIENAENYHFQILDESGENVIEERTNVRSSYDTVDVTIRNLEASSVYQWRVRGANEGGEGPWTDNYSFTTAPEPPESEVVLAGPEDGAEDVPTELILKWTVVENAAAYHLQVRDNDTKDFAVNDTIPAPEVGDTVASEVSELDGLTTYEWRVCAMNASGAGPWSDYKTFTTWDPSDVEDLNAENIISVIPNPVYGEALIIVEAELQNNVEIQVYDVTGRVVEKVYEGASALSGEYTWRADALDAGVYFIVVKLTGGTFCRKTIVID